MEFFQYGETETNYLKSRDKKLGEVIDTLGHINREVHPDLFSALVNSIIGQQISTKAQITIWNRLKDQVGQITPKTIEQTGTDRLQSIGISFRKVQYIQSAAREVLNGNLDLEGLHLLPDDEVCRQLVKLPGVGVWTAEMLMTFSMQRPDIVSFGDLAILRGMRMLYHHRAITPELFHRYRKRYSPYGTVASLYLWAVAGGAIEGMKDYAPKKQSGPKSKRNSV